LPTLSDPFGRTIKLRPNPLSSALRNRLLITFVVKDGSCFYKHKKPSLICESQNKYNATLTVCYTAIHGILRDCKSLHICNNMEYCMTANLTASYWCNVKTFDSSVSFVLYF